MQNTVELKGGAMSSGQMKLNRRFFDKNNLKVENMHKLSQTENVSYPTLLKYLKTDVDRFDGNVLYAIIVTGMGYSPEEASKLELGQIFDFVDHSKEVAVK